MAFLSNSASLVTLLTSLLFFHLFLNASALTTNSVHDAHKRSPFQVPKTTRGFSSDLVPRVNSWTGGASSSGNAKLKRNMVSRQSTGNATCPDATEVNCGIGCCSQGDACCTDGCRDAVDEFCCDDGGACETGTTCCGSFCCGDGTTCQAGECVSGKGAALGLQADSSYKGLVYGMASFTLFAILN